MTELAWHEGDKSYSLGEIKTPRHARMSIFDKDGKVLARWGTPEVTAPGSFAAPHGLALDSKNDLYVSEVTWTFAVSRGRAPEDCHTFQKFSLKPSPHVSQLLRPRGFSRGGASISAGACGLIEFWAGVCFSRH